MFDIMNHKHTQQQANHQLDSNQEKRFVIENCFDGVELLSEGPMIEPCCQDHLQDWWQILIQ